MAGFSAWYHATSRAAARSIEQSGLTARRYGANLDGLGAAYHVLAQDPRQAEGLTQAEPGDQAIVTVRVPDDQQAEYLTDLQQIEAMDAGTAYAAAGTSPVTSWAGRCTLISTPMSSPGSAARRSCPGSGCTTAATRSTR